MSVSEPGSPSDGPASGDRPTGEVCPLCGAPVGANDTRCPACNLSLAGVGTRPGPFDRRALWFWAGGLLVIYVVVLAIVVAAS